ncbi:MAG: CehA/McbA family metallohydrolase, partial [Planctomycetes bacterium]|nr:CehA/McbA family metallohydrolase [Planctomycetota bacterium]
MLRLLVCTGIVLAGCLAGHARAQAPRPEGEEFFFIPPGFHQEGLPRTVAGENTGTVKITVVDQATGKPTPCRIAVVAADGQFYQPAKNRLSPYGLTGKWPTKGDWGNRAEKAPWRYLGRYFYSTGTTEVQVPPGTVRIEVSKGWEFAPVWRSVEVVAGQNLAEQLTLQRTVPMHEHRYFNGDIHLHFPRASREDDDLVFDLLDAEDIQYGTLLAYNEPAGPYSGAMTTMDSPQYRGYGEKSLRTRGLTSILSGQEYRSAHYGHIMYYLRDRLVHEGHEFNIDEGGGFGPTSADVLADGGLVVYAHGGYAMEIYADAALGNVSGVELLQFGIYRPIGLEGWYQMLSTGYRLPAYGACDFPACRFLGDCRTYVWTAQSAEDRPSLPDWLKASVRGQSFISTGPMLLMEVRGRRPGESLKLTGKQSHEIPVSLRVRCEVTPVQQLDLIVNGATVERIPIPAEKARGAWFEVQRV